MRVSHYSLMALLLIAGMLGGPARAESPEEWIALGTRVHGGFGAFIPLGIRIGLDAVARLDAKPRELAVVYHDSARSPCACFADGIAIATSASVGQRHPDDRVRAGAGGRDRGCGHPSAQRRRRLQVCDPVAALSRLGAMNEDLDPRRRYDAVMRADGLFRVEPIR